MTTQPKAEAADLLEQKFKVGEISIEQVAKEALAALRSLAAAPQEPVAFQSRVDPWLMECFGQEIARDVLERNHRFLEEAMELVQANGCTITEAHQLVDYVYGRDQGDINQEVGGVMVTLAALCLASGVDMHAAAETELARVWTKIEKIRAKHFAKPKFSPLPGYASPVAAVPAQEPVMWTCAARKQSLPEPADCNWPVCGCDPYADRVIEALQESGSLK